MSKELAEQFGIKIGEKVIYPNYIPYVVRLEVVTVKDITTNYKDEIVVLTEEHEGYLDITDIYTKDTLIKMFE